MTKNRTRTPVYLDPGMHPGLEVKGLKRVQLVLEKNPYLASTQWHAISFKKYIFYMGHVDNKTLSRRLNLEKWNESGFRPPLCTYRLNWARRTSWGWWDDWDDTVLQTQDSKFEPWRSEAEHATSRSRRLPTILTFTRGWGRNIFCFFQTAETGNRTPNSGVKGSGANHYPRAPALSVVRRVGSFSIQWSKTCQQRI